MGLQKGENDGAFDAWEKEKSCIYSNGKRKITESHGLVPWIVRFGARAIGNGIAHGFAWLVGNPVTLIEFFATCQEQCLVTDAVPAHPFARPPLRGGEIRAGRRLNSNIAPLGN